MLFFIVYLLLYRTSLAKFEFLPHLNSDQDRDLPTRSYLDSPPREGDCFSRFRRHSSFMQHHDLFLRVVRLNMSGNLGMLCILIVQKHLSNLFTFGRISLVLVVDALG